MNCTRLKKVSIRVWRSADYDNDEMINVSCFHCSVTGKYMYPLRMEKRGISGYAELADTEEEILQQPMVKECEYQLKDESILDWK